jgi:hypothetical protein
MLKCLMTAVTHGSMFGGLHIARLIWLSHACIDQSLLHYSTGDIDRGTFAVSSHFACYVGWVFSAHTKYSVKQTPFISLMSRVYRTPSVLISTHSISDVSWGKVRSLTE